MQILSLQAVVSDIQSFKNCTFLMSLSIGYSHLGLRMLCIYQTYLLQMTCVWIGVWRN